MNLYVFILEHLLIIVFEIEQNKLYQVRDNFILQGVSVAEWSRLNGFSLQLVYKILNGKSKGLRGEGHKIAVALGLKPLPKCNE